MAHNMELATRLGDFREARMLVPSLQAWLQVSQMLVFTSVGYTGLHCSLRTLYRKCERFDPLLMVLKSTNDAVRLHTLLIVIFVSNLWKIQDLLNFLHILLFLSIHHQF